MEPMRGDTFIHFVCGNRRVNIQSGVLLLIPKFPHLQHILIPMLLLPLLVDEFATSTIESKEAKINKYTRKWLGLPAGLFDAAKTPN